jgi:hypothetical protein
VNSSFSQQLKEAMDLAVTAGDDDLSSVDIGAIFLNAMTKKSIILGEQQLFTTAEGGHGPGCDSWR